MSITAEMRNVENAQGLYDKEHLIRILNVTAAAEEQALKERSFAARLKRETEAESLKRIEDLPRDLFARPSISSSRPNLPRNSVPA